MRGDPLAMELHRCLDVKVVIADEAFASAPPLQRPLYGETLVNVEVNLPKETKRSFEDRSDPLERGEYRVLDVTRSVRFLHYMPS